jgi:hypothetical protein
MTPTPTAVHIYTRNHQPATRFVIDIGFEKPRRFWTRNPPHRLVPTSCCRKRRWAQHCTVQVYYDRVPFWCRPGKGCKS